MSKEAMKLALEVIRNQGDVSVDEWIAAEKALQALAEQPAQQEPVAYIRLSKTGHVMACAKTGDFYKLPDKTLLYTSPPAQRTWVGLNDDELADFWFKQSLDWMEFARVIEDALRSKNT